jgi:ABC-type multidrug transport system fused ATPase/permease subunit
VSESTVPPEPTAASKPVADSSRGAFGRLIKRVGRAALEHRWLVVGVVGFAAIEAFLTKAPLLLILPLLEALEETPSWQNPPPVLVRSSSDWLLVLFAEFSRWFGSLLGIESWDSVDGTRHLVVLTCAAVSGLCGLVGGFAIYFATMTSRMFATRIVVDLRNEVAEHFVRLPLRFFGRRRMGELISNVTNDTAVLSRSFSLAADHAVADPFQILWSAAFIAWVEPRALIVFALLVPAFALPIVRLGKKVHKRTRGSLAAMGESTESMNQMLSGIRTVKAFQLEQLRLDEFRDSNETWYGRVVGTLRAKGWSQGTTFIGYQLIFAALVLLFGWLALSGELELAQIGVVGALLATTYTHIKRLARTYNSLMESLGALDRVEEILFEQPDVGALRSGRMLEHVEGRVKMEGVGFAYDTEPVLTDLSFDVAPGTTVALVGPSGGGKTTTIDLLLRFHDPLAGRILIDGVDLREIDLTSYRRHIAIVDQHPFLFNTTVYENIACGLPPGQATRESVEAAARSAQAHEFITALPNGYDTIVGERGGSLSGGQRQRITIARAILRDPAILFLDEATSALDSESEEAVQTALNNLMRGRTTFVIAHRLSTIRDAAKILVLDRGRLVETGTHAELLARPDGLYARMIQLQQVG